MKKSVLLLSLLIGGCAEVRPLATEATLVLTPHIEAGSYTQTLRPPYTQASVHHLALKLYPLVDGVPQALLMQRVLSNAQLENPIVISSLKANASYRIYPYAYLSADDSQLISHDDAAFYTDIVVGNDNSPTLAPLPVRLINQVFNGQATSSGMAISDGGYYATGSEALSSYTSAIMDVSTIAGGTTTGFNDGRGVFARFNNPYGLTFDGSGNLYVADYSNYRIRKIAPNGMVSTVAGNGLGGAGVGIATAVRMNDPAGLVFDSTGSLYVTDYNRVVKITSDGNLSTLAGGNYGMSDGLGGAAQFKQPMGITRDSHDNLYVADGGNYRIRKITPDGNVTTFAGNGTSATLNGQGTLAELYYPYGITCDSNDNLYVTEQSGNCIRMITPDGTVSTLAGGRYGTADGVGTAASFSSPYGITCDSNNNLYVIDNGSGKIRKVTAEGVVTTVAGYGGAGYVDGLGPNAMFYYLQGITIDAAGNLYVADKSSIRKVRWLAP